MLAHFVGGPMHGTDRDVGNRSQITVYTVKHASMQETLEARTDDGFHYVTPAYQECAGEYRRFFSGAVLSDAAGGTDLPSIFLWMEQ